MNGMFVGGNFRFLCAPTYMSFHTDKKVPTKILKEIAVFKCENAKNFQEIDRSLCSLTYFRFPRCWCFVGSLWVVYSEGKLHLMYVSLQKLQNIFK